VVAAHDLALIRAHSPDDAVWIGPWQPAEAPDNPGLAGASVSLALSDPKAPLTGQAELLGLVPAAELLGADHPGELLAAFGAPVTRGDSGSGVFADCDAIATPLDDCVGGSSAVLLGVLQDANPERASAPFGIVPLWPAEHAAWIRNAASPAPP